MSVGNLRPNLPSSQFCKLQRVYAELSHGLSPNLLHSRTLQEHVVQRLNVCSHPVKPLGHSDLPFSLPVYLGPHSAHRGRGWAWQLSALATEWRYCFGTALGCLFSSDGLFRFDRKNILKATDRADGWHYVAGKLCRPTLWPTRERAGLETGRLSTPVTPISSSPTCQSQGPCSFLSEFLRNFRVSIS